MTARSCALFRICFLLFPWIIYRHNQVLGCTSTTVQHKRSGEDVTIQFQARTVNTVNSALAVTNQIISSNDSSLVTVIYINGVNTVTFPCTGCTFTGNVATGDLSIRLTNIQAAEGGTYKHSISESSSQVKGCVTVYILGIPESPTIQADNNNIEGRNIRLTCNSKSTTNPRDPDLSLLYKWKVDNAANPVDTRYIYSQSRHTLTINNLEKQDANKRFTCEATESGPGVTGLTSISSNEYRINVLYGPDLHTTTLSPTQSIYTLEEGKNLPNITCQGDCNPGCSYRWTIPENKQVASGDILSLGTLTRENATVYTCLVTNTMTSSSVSRNVSVNVIYGPDANSVALDPKPTKYVLNEQEPLADITCGADCYPSCNFKWTKSGTNNHVSSTQKLQLGTLNRNEADTYSCTATNPTSRKIVIKSIIVSVRYGPDRCEVSVPSQYNVTEGTTQGITCQSECYPGCSYKWKNISDGTVISQNGAFLLGTVSREHTGNYKCFCKNTASQYQKEEDTSVNISVQYPPDVSIISSTGEYLEEKPLMLTCDAKGNPSTYNYNGFTQTFGDSVIHNGRSSVSGTLRIPSLQLQDTGNYTCYVNNGVKLPSGKLKDSTNSTFVGVQVRPKILTYQLRFAGVTGNTAFVQVKLYSYPDIKKVTFVRYDGLTITDVSGSKYEIDIYKTVVENYFYSTYVSLDGSFLNMSISNLQEDDFGNYTLILENEIGTSNATIFLDAESVPSEPKHFVYSYEDSSHKFSWVRGFNGGHSQTFVIQISIAGLDEWVNQTIISKKKQNQYTANVSYILPGTYTARIFAWNSIGTSSFVVLNGTFTIEEDISKRKESEKTAIVAAAVSSVVVIIAIIVSLLCFWRRTVFEKMCYYKEQKERKHGQTTPENSYYNLSSLDKTSDKPEPESSIHYEVLDGSGRIETSQTYESLQTTQLDMSSKKTATVNKDGIYENLKLKRKVETE